MSGGSDLHGGGTGAVWAFAGWDDSGGELPYRRLRSDGGVVRPRALRARAVPCGVREGGGRGVGGVCSPASGGGAGSVRRLALPLLRAEEGGDGGGARGGVWAGSACEGGAGGAGLGSGRRGMWVAALRAGLGGVLAGLAGVAAGWQAACLRAAVAGGAGAPAAAVPVVGAGAGGGGAGAGVPEFAGLRGVGGGVRAGVRGVEGDESVGRHAEDVDDNFGGGKQWTHKLWGFVRDAFGDG